MPNLYWYFILIFGSLLLFVFTLWKSFIPRARAILIFFYIGGLAYILEYVIKVIFRSYDYFPHILENAWFDSLFGATISQGIFVPTVAMCIVAFGINTLWVIGICILIMGIEEGFIRLGIYEHHWWKTIYTGILIFIGFNMAKWWDRMLINRKPWVDYVNIYLLLILFSNMLVYLLTSIWLSHLFQVGAFKNATRDSVFTEATFIFIHSVAVSFLLQRKWKWYWFLVLYLIDWGLITLFEHVGIIQFFHFWNPALYALFPMAVALFVNWLYYRLIISCKKRLT
ncbi:hypothetical protein [Niallia sp. Krafla_26]|uniref:hypothetical protein n=1 Tax=Niallia sp. Krafla_26 TaxID=3064703 RepID=UPI003D163403